MTGLKPRAAIAGIYEYPYRNNSSHGPLAIKAMSAVRALEDAGLALGDVDALYDAGEVAAHPGLEFAEYLGLDPDVLGTTDVGGSYVEGGRLRFDRPGGPALNTDGGGLSSNHPGMRGLFLLIEAARQLRGESTAQVADARLAVAHGNGVLLGSRHVGGTVILGRE
jgi:acetyl-CoA C-acetyltransferase